MINQATDQLRHKFRASNRIASKPFTTVDNDEKNP